MNTEGNIDISLDKKSYFSGESVKALFKTPFSGKMLVTMETDHVISHQYVEVGSNRSADLDLKLTGEHVPNVYITATLIKPHEVVRYSIDGCPWIPECESGREEPEDRSRNCGGEKSTI